MAAKLAELSDETQAIIARLKAEGDLARNSGTNSVRSVKVQLDKFENVFNAISLNIEEQNDMLKLQLGMDLDAKERRDTQEQLQEVATKGTPSNDDSPKKSKDRDIGKIAKSIKDAVLSKKFLMAAGGTFLGYNLLKGFIDEKTGGGFTEMQNTIADVKWADVTTGFAAMTGAMTTINWTNFANSINSMSNAVNTFTTWIGTTGIGDIVSAVVAGGLVSAGAKGLVMGALAKSGGGVGMAGRLAGIGPGIALVAAGLAVYYGDEITNWLKKQTSAESPEMQNGIEKLVVVGQAGLATMSIGAMFGPPGILAVAAVTAAVGLGVLIKSWIDKSKRIQSEEFSEQVDAALIKAQSESDVTNLSDDATRDIAQAIVEARRRTRLAIGDNARAEAAAAQKQLEAMLSMQDVGDGTEGADILQRSRLRRQIIAGDQNAIEELQTYVMGFAKETEGSFSRWRPFGENQTNREFAEDQIRRLGNTSFRDDNLTRQEQVDQFKLWEGLSEEIIKGLPADVLIDDDVRNRLKNSMGPARNKDGRLIIFDEFGTPRELSNQEQNGPLGKLLKSGFDISGGGMTIINAPTIAPAPVTINNGGSSVKQVSFNGGGGGASGPSLLPYGITGSVA